MAKWLQIMSKKEREKNNLLPI